MTPDSVMDLLHVTFSTEHVRFSYICITGQSFTAEDGLNGRKTTPGKPEGVYAVDAMTWQEQDEDAH